MAEGDIGTVIDTLEFALTDIAWPDMVKVADDVVAIAYADADGDGMVVTVDIDAAGQIGAAVVDSLEFDTLDGHHPSIVHVLGDIYAIAYQGVDSDGFIVTVEITAAGAISAAVIDSLEFETVTCNSPRMIKVADNMVAIVHQGATNEGVITTVQIEADGQIGAAVTDREYEWAAHVAAPEIVHVAGNIYAIVSYDALYNGWLHTISISAAGGIGATVVDSLEFDAGFGADPDICHVLGDIYAIAYRGGGDDGFIVTVEITAAGAISAAVIDTLEFETDFCTWPDIIHIGSGIVAIAYLGTASDGFICTVQIEANGQIGAAVIDRLEFDVGAGYFPSLVFVLGDIYAIAYRGGGDDGYIKTLGIETPVAAGVKHLMITGVG